jgi:hypothetical protein
MAVPADFDAQEYLRQNPDVAAAGVDAAEHYEKFGRAEGRAAPRVKKPSPSQAPQMPKPPKVDPVFIEAQADEFVSGPDPLSTDIDTTTAFAETSDLMVAMPDRFETPDVETATITPSLGEMDTLVGGLSTESIIEAPQGEVSSESLARSATAELDERATVQ